MPWIFSDPNSWDILKPCIRSKRHVDLTDLCHFHWVCLQGVCLISRQAVYTRFTSRGTCYDATEDCQSTQTLSDMAPRNRRSLSPSPQTVKLSINSVLCASLLLLLVTVPGISCFSNEKPSSSDSSLSSQTPSPVKSDGDGSVESAQRGGTARSRAQGQKADKRKEGGYLSLGRKQTPVRPINICSNRSCTTQVNK